MMKCVEIMFLNWPLLHNGICYVDLYEKLKILYLSSFISKCEKCRVLENYSSKRKFHLLLN